MKEALVYYLANKPEFDLWVELFSKIPSSHDKIKPLIEPFEAANPGVNIHSCSECIIDMLIWYRMQAKSETPKESKK